MKKSARPKPCLRHRGLDPPASANAAGSIQVSACLLYKLDRWDGQMRMSGSIVARPTLAMIGLASEVNGIEGVLPFRPVTATTIIIEKRAAMGRRVKLVCPTSVLPDFQRAIEDSFQFRAIEPEGELV